MSSKPHTSTHLYFTFLLSCPSTDLLRSIRQASGCKPISILITCYDNILDTSFWHSLSTTSLHHQYSHQNQDSTEEVFWQNLSILFSPFFMEIASTYYLPHLWEVTAQSFDPASMFKNIKDCMYRMPSPRPQKLVCLIHSQTQSRINTFPLLFSPSVVLQMHWKNIFWHWRR